MTDVVARIGARVDAIGAGDDRTAVISGHERNTSSMMDWPVLPVLLRDGRHGNYDLILLRLAQVRHDDHDCGKEDQTRGRGSESEPTVGFRL